tara:strand:- start:25 stop:408 length:384 start_codon:yes stop_codon:yes gene_type:complete
MSVLELNGRVFDASTTGTLTLTGEGSATTDVTQGLAKSWIQGTAASSISTQDSFNFSSVTDTSTGRITPQFANNMGNSGFSAPMVSNQLHMALSSSSTSSFNLTAYNSSHSEVDSDQMCSTVHGDLA